MLKMSETPVYMNDIDALVTAAYEGKYELVCSLIADGANPNVINEYGEIAIIVAAENGYDIIIEHLLSHGADINAKDNDGDTALDIAKYHNFDNTIELLISRGGVRKIRVSH